MKLSFVSPRFGKDIVGGAEYAVSQLAQNCLIHGGAEVEILTTTAGDERTWSKKYESGEEEVDGIKIRRFNNDAIVRDEFDSWGSQFFGHLHEMTDGQFDQWLIRQGPYSKDLLDAIEESDSDAIVFHPMISSPTSHGIFRAKKPTILHPALHDEPLARMPGYKKVANAVTLLSFSTYFEQSLSRELFQTDLVRQAVIGFGIDDVERSTGHEVTEVLNKYGLDASKYAIVLGRVDVGKGSDVIARFFEQYSKSYDKDLKLIFVGPISGNSILSKAEYVDRNSERIITTGLVSDVERDILLANATALINPSVTESFSLVMLEAMKSKVPVIINSACGPTLEHVIRSNSGYMFEDFTTFCASLQMATTDSLDRDKRIVNGFRYVENNYSWNSVIEQYMKLINNLLY